MGLNDDKKTMIKLLSKQIKKASQNTILKKSSNLRFWLVSGTAGIAQSINLAFPNSNLFLYLTGGGQYIKKVIAWAKYNKNIIILNDNINYNINGINNDYKKYYESVDNYDSLIWPYVKKYGKDGDFIWNVASD